MKRLLMAAIRFYQCLISPAFPGACRFFPTCSTYAMEAVERNGAWKGSVLAIRRLMKCHPWHPGGFDPVPSPKEGSGPEAAGPCDKKTQTEPVFR